MTLFNILTKSLMKRFYNFKTASIKILKSYYDIFSLLKIVLMDYTLIIKF